MSYARTRKRKMTKTKHRCTPSPSPFLCLVRVQLCVTLLEGGALCHPCQALCVNSAHHTELAHRMREVHGVRRHCLVHLQRQREITKWDGNGERQREVSKWDGNGSVPSGHQTRSSCAPPTRSAGAASRHCEHNAGTVREIERERVVEWEGQTYLRSVAHARTFLCASQSTSTSERCDCAFFTS